MSTKYISKTFHSSKHRYTHLMYLLTSKIKAFSKMTKHTYEKQIANKNTITRIRIIAGNSKHEKFLAEFSNLMKLPVFRQTDVKHYSKFFIKKKIQSTYSKE
jgi:hypothetical protein